MKHLVFIVTFLTSFAVFAEEAIVIEKAKAARTNDVFSVELAYKGPWTATELNTEFVGEALQADIAGAKLAKGKQLIKIDDVAVRSIYLSQPTAGAVRARINFKKGIVAKSYENAFRIINQNGTVSFQMIGSGDASAAATGDTEIVRAYPVIGGEAETTASTAGADPELLAPAKLVASEAAVKEVAESEVPLEKPAPIAADAKEADIPVLVGEKKDKKGGINPMHRALITLGVLAALLGGASFGLKKFMAKNKKQNQNTQIKILTQHYLGPKKQLAIVQVAGESLLIGVTDHSITMLKSLSLLDEEIPTEVPRNFDDAMGDFDEAVEGREEAGEPEDFAYEGLAKIRDRVSGRLKGMRRLS